MYTQHSLMWLAATFVLIGFSPAAGASEDDALPRGHVFFQEDFEGPDPLSSWSGSAAVVVDEEGGKVLCLERPAGLSHGSTTVRMALPVEQMRGYVVHFAARVRAEGVSEKPNPWNGIKFMAPWTGVDDQVTWPSTTLEDGSFGWRQVALRVALPHDAKQIDLVLGLELVSGRVWFDDVRVTAYRPLPTRRQTVVAGPMYKGHKLPRLRGAMIGPRIDEEGLRVFGQQWNANVIRWQLIRRGRVAEPLDLDAYDDWLQEELARLDMFLPVCQECGLYVVLDLHSPPGGRSTQGGYAGSNHGLFTSAECQRKFVEVWQHMARRYENSPAIWAYDLANEPVEEAGSEQLDDWHALAERAGRAIRAIDADRTIIVEPPNWGSPAGLKYFAPIDVPNVVYSVHVYVPHAFTHQNVHSRTTPKSYPGTIDGVHWDKARLREALEPVVEFQQTYNVHIYIGEFSAIRWAPDHSAYRYLRDVIELFEEYEWDWTYHAFREWDGWSVEHGADRQDRSISPVPTDRKKLLQSWFAKNRKPSWQ